MAEIKRSLAVVIGINQYINGIPPLKTAVNDAAKLTINLKEKFQYNVLQLLNTEASYEKLTQLFTALQSQTIPLADGTSISVQSDDRVLFYFAGHGIAVDGIDNADGPAGFLVPQDAQLIEQNSWIPMQQLHDALVKLPCRHLLVVLDCCFAGSFRWAGHSRHAVRSQKVYRERYDRFVTGFAQQVITSAAHDEKAADSLYRFGQRGEGEDHSPFAELLLKALSREADFTNDGVITATELYLYLHSELGKTVAKQTPGMCQLKHHDKGEYIFPIPGFDPKGLDEAPKLDENKNPYRGLESFDEEHSNLFFGRKVLIDQLTEFVSSHQLTVVLGASGSGKSSLVKAGLIPQLRNLSQSVEVPTLEHSDTPQSSWQILPPIRLGEAPFSALNRILLQESAATAHVDKGDYQQATETLLKNLGHWMQLNPQSQLLIIDQAEELFTLCPNKTEREQFLHSLKQALATYPERLHIVLTLRSDFEPQFRDTALEDYWMEARFTVPAMTRDELREAITEPATVRVIYFEPPKLIDQLIDEVVQMPGALPLLSFTLSELYLKYIKSVGKEERNNRAITQEDYEQLGGVTRSLTQRADCEYDELVKLDLAYAKTIRNVMLRMVAIGGGDLARRQVLCSELEYPEPENGRIKEVIGRFVDARLLVKGRDPDGKEYVEPAHDALVRGWQKLRTWKEENLGNLLLQHRLTPAAEEWSANKKKGFLWDDDPRLPLLQQVMNSADSWFNQAETEFVRRSIQRRQNNRRQTIGIVTGVITSLFVLGVTALIQLQSSLLREKAARVENLLTSTPVDGLILAIQATAQNRFWFRGNILNPVKFSLLNAIQVNRERDIFIGHKHYVRAVAFSPNGKMIVSGSQDNSLRLWDLKGNPINPIGEPFRGHTRPVTSVAFSIDGKMIVSGSEDKTLRLWDISGKKIEPPLHGHSEPVQSVAISPDGKMIVSGSKDKTLRLWDISGKKIEPPLHGHSEPVQSVAISPDSKMIVSGSQDGTVRLWNISGKPIGEPFRSQQNKVWSVAISPDGKMIASGSDNGRVHLWDLKGKLLEQMISDKRSAVLSVRFSRDSKSIVSGHYDNTVRLWDTSGNSIGQPLLGHKEQVSSIAISPNDNIMVSGSFDSTLRLWDISNNQIGQPLLGHEDDVGHENDVLSVAISPNSKMIVSGNKDNTIRLWNISGNSIGKPLEEHNTVRAVAVSPDSKMIVSGSDGGTVLWDISGKPIRKPLQGHKAVQSVAISPNSKMIVSGSEDNTIRLWSTSGTPIGNPLQEHTQAVRAVAISPNSKMIVSGSDDSTVRLWNISGNPIGKPLQGHTQGVRAVAVSPDSKVIVSGSDDGTIRLWDTSGNPIGRPFSGHTRSISAVAFSRDGKMIVSSSLDRTVRLWDTSGNPIGQMFSGHTLAVKTVAISPDGKTIVSGSNDNTVRLWSAQWEAWLETACNQLQYHRMLENPQTSEQQEARNTCQKYVWDRR